VVLVALPACARGETPTAAPTSTVVAGSPRPHPFLWLYRGYRADYNPARTPDQLAAWSELVVVAKLVGIREGRVEGQSADDPARAEHLRYEFAVTKTLKGKAEGTVYVEAIKPDFKPAATYDDAAPDMAPAVIYLRRYAPDRPYDFTTPQGFIIELDGRVGHPMEASPSISSLFPGGDPAGNDLMAWAPKAR
jgi:hypothetical protein